MSLASILWYDILMRKRVLSSSDPEEVWVLLFELRHLYLKMCIFLGIELWSRLEECHPKNTAVLSRAFKYANQICTAVVPPALKARTCTGLCQRSRTTRPDVVCNVQFAVVPPGFIDTIMMLCRFVSLRAGIARELGSRRIRIFR